MPLPIIAITIDEQETPLGGAPPTTPDHEVAVVGDLTITNGTLATAFPLNTPTLVPNRAAWQAFGTVGGDVARTVTDVYQRADVPVVIVRTVPRDARGDTPYNPTDAELTAGVTALGTIPTTLNLRPRFLAAPESYKRNTTGTSGANQAGDADSAVDAVNPVASGLDAQAETLRSVAVLSAPPVGDGGASNVANMTAWSAANRGSHIRLVHVGNRQTVGGADENSDMSGAVIGAVIAKERDRGVGVNANYAPVTAGVPSPVLSNSYGEDATDDAARLSAAGVIGIVREQGLHLWGNTFAVADDSSQYRYIAARRAVDEVIRATRVVNRSVFSLDVGDRLFRRVESDMGTWLRHFISEDGIRDGGISRDDVRNTQAAARAGTAYFTISLELLDPVRQVIFTVAAVRQPAAA